MRGGEGKALVGDVCGEFYSFFSRAEIPHNFSDLQTHPNFHSPV